MEQANWFQRVQLHKQWQTTRMDELEKQVDQSSPNLSKPEP